MLTGGEKKGASNDERENSRERDGVRLSTGSGAEDLIRSLPEDARIKVYQGTSYIGSFFAGDVQVLQGDVEEYLLETFGPGQYLLVPVVDGRPDRSQKARVWVGRGAAVKNPLESTIEELKEELAQMRQQPQLDWAQFVPAIIGGISSLMSAMAPDRDLLKELIVRMAEERNDENEAAIRELLASVRDSIARQPSPQEQLSLLLQMMEQIKALQQDNPSSAFSSTLNHGLALLSRALFRGSQPTPVTEHHTERVIDVEPEPSSELHEVAVQPQSASPRPKSGRGGFVDRFLSNLREFVERGDPDEIATYLVSSYNAAVVLGYRHELVDQFAADPAGTIDRLGGLVGMPENLKAAVSERIVEMFQRSRSASVEADDGE